MARYALAIAIAHYNNFRNLPKAATDAQRIAQTLGEFGRFEVQPLPGKLIESENCWQVAPEKKLAGKDLGLALRTFLLEKAKNHEALIYFAGHGFKAPTLTGEEKGYLATYDCKDDGQNAIAFDDFNALIAKSQLSSLVVLLDCCYAGSFLEKSFIRSSFPIFNSRQDYCLITASRDFERAREDAEGGIFTQALLTGLSQDRADPATGEVDANNLISFISRELKGSGQEAIYMGGGRSITLVWYPPQHRVDVVVREECPYQGLKYFDESTAQFFFGRKQVVEILIQKLEQAAFVPVIGASGSGKSSVVRAGLIPALKNNGWRVLDPIFPGVEPLAELKGAFNKQFDRTEIREISHLIDTDGLRPVIERLPGSERWLLVIDQFEEVFTVCSQPEERRRFIELLTQVAEIPTSRLVIVTMMRADFLEPCLSYQSLTGLIQDRAVYMPPLVGEELEEAIASPAKLQGYDLETGLLGAILDDVGKEKDCLPLLQFALTELWEKRDRTKHQLTREQYRILGGVTGALNRHAEKVYTYKDFFKESLQQQRTPQEQELIEGIFLRLVRTGAGDKDTRQRQPKVNLLGIAEDNSEQQAISNLLEELINPGRLLVGDRQENQQKQAWVDLAHEALIEGWERFAKWREKDRDLRRLRDRLDDARQEWLNRGQEDNYLIMGGLLAEVRQNWEKIKLRLPDEAKAFYQKSHAHEQDRIAELQQPLTESRLRERAARVQNLLPVKPLDGLVLAVESIGLNLAQLPGEILSSVQDSLHRAMEIAREENFLQRHEDYVYSVAISPDGQYIVSGSRDKTLRLWDIQGNLIGQPFQGHENAVMSVAFSPDGQYIVSGSQDKTVQLWDRKGNPIGQPFPKLKKLVRCVAFSPDGQYIVTGSDDNTVRLWDTKGNLIGQPFKGHQGAVWSVAFSPDGKIIASSSADKTVRFWDIQGNPIGQPFKGHENSVTSVAFSPDGRYIVSGSKDKTVRLWDTNGNLIGQPFRGHDSDIFSVAFSPDGQKIASGSDDKTVRLWDTNGNLIGQPLRGHESDIFSVAFSPDGATIVTGSKDKTVRLWDTKGSFIGQPFQEHEDTVLSVAVSPDGQIIVSGSRDGTVRLWDRNGNLIGLSFQEHKQPVVSVAFSPDGQRIISGGDDRTVRLWDRDGNPIGHPFTGHNLAVMSVAFSPDGQYIVSGSADNTVRLWDRKGNPIGQPFRGHTNLVRSVAFSPDGQYIVSGSDDKTVRLWDRKGNPIGQPFRGHEAPVKSIAFSPDGQKIASGSDDKTLRLWNLLGNPIGQPFRGHEDGVKSVAFSADGQYIVSGSKDKTVRLWDLLGNPIGQPFRGHESGVYSVAFSPDEQTIISGSDDKTVRLWRGAWRAWLKVCCNRLRYHPAFKDPQTEDEKAACEVCKKYVWGENV